MINRLGQQLGNYRLVRLLGRGGFAEVYLGEHIHLGTQAAIKVLHTQLTSEDVDKFRMEARTIARLMHPHIVRVLEFGLEDKTPFLVMDYAPHSTLRQRHPKGEPLPLPTVITYVKQIADALQYAHDQKLIHRDVKPENMLVGRCDEILLSDFGIALVAQSSRYQSVQDMAGTMAYMAPEQIQGKPRPASDQYSLGIVVYEWLSGHRPFHGSLTEMVGQHLSTPPPSLREKVSTIPASVEQVVMRALEKDPHQRFTSVKAFADTLEEVIRTLPTRFDTLPPNVTFLKQSPSSIYEVVEASSRPLPPPSGGQGKRRAQSSQLCFKCETENRSDAKFCKRCGFRLTSTSRDDTPTKEAVRSSLPETGLQENNNLEIERLLEEAQSLRLQKRLNEAATLYEQVLQLDKTNALAWQGKGLTQGMRSFHQDALVAFEGALQLNPSLVVSWCGKGVALSRLGRYQEALNVFDKAQHLEPNNASAWNGKGVTLNAMNRCEDALQAFIMALRINPHLAEAWNNKGLVLQKLKRSTEALKAFDQALSFNRTLTTALNGKGRILHDFGRLQAALEAFEEFCSYDPTLPAAWEGKGAVLYDMGRYEDALQAFQESFRLNKNYTPALYGMGNFYYAQQQFSRALNMFSKATELDPNYIHAWYQHGNVLSSLGDWKKALNTYDRALSIDMDCLFVLRAKALLLCQLERYYEAIAIYEQILRINPNSSVTWNGLGNAYYQVGNYAQALQSYEHTLKLNEKMPGTWHNKALVLNRLERYKEALEAAERAIQIRPNDPDNWDCKAYALKGLKGHELERREAQAEAKRLRRSSSHSR